MGRKKISLVINNNHKSMFKQGNYQAWWDTAIMLALIMKKQEDIEFKADLDYISRFNNKKKNPKFTLLCWYTWYNTYLKKVEVFLNYAYNVHSRYPTFYRILDQQYIFLSLDSLFLEGKGH
jgi:hypothetical protein